MDYPNKATRKFIESVIDEEAIPTSLMAIIGYLDPETGEFHTAFVNFTAEISTFMALGQLELAKDDLKGLARVGPHDPFWAQREPEGEPEGCEFSDLSPTWCNTHATFGHAPDDG